MEDSLAFTITDNCLAMWALPAYTMQGVHAEFKNAFSKSAQNYIVTSRIVQGDLDLKDSTQQERKDIILRWNSVKFDLKNFYALKNKEAREEKKAADPQGEASAEIDIGMSPPRTGWNHTRHLSFEQRKKLHAKKDGWKRSHVETRIPSSGEAGHASNPEIDEEFERAIQQSVRETSHGDAAEDARIEAAIRASLQNLQERGAPLPGTGVLSYETAGQGLEITDGEYQALIERAIQQSVMLQSADVQPEHLAGDSEEDEAFKLAVQESMRHQQQQSGREDHGEDLERAIAESKAIKRRPVPAPLAPAADEEDEDLKRAIEASKSAHEDQKTRDDAAKTEEEIVLEYVKRQSLAEVEYRNKIAKGKAVGDIEQDEEVDEELRKGLEESLKLLHPDGAGPSGEK
jgi:hypothetical protein